MLTVARSVARAITASHRLLPVTSSAYDRVRLRSRMGSPQELRRLTRFWRTTPMRNVLSGPTRAADFQSCDVPLILFLPLGPPRNSWAGAAESRRPSRNSGRSAPAVSSNHWSRQHPLPDDRRRWPDVSRRTRPSGSRSAGVFSSLTTRSRADPSKRAPTIKYLHPR